MIKPEILEQLKSSLGEDKVSISSGKVFLFPQESKSIAEIVKLAYQKNFKVFPSGKETKKKFDSNENYVVIKTDKLNEIKKVVPEDLYIILEPGLGLKELNRQISSYNLFYPLSTENAWGTVGGSIATALEGKNKNREIKSKDYALSLEVVSPIGEILKVGARTFKSVTGYDLPRLYVGSWGSLGIITEITLRLIPIGKKDEYENIVLNTPFRKNINPSSEDPKDKLNLHLKELLDPHRIFPNL